MKKATGMVIKAVRKHLNYKQEFVANKLNITVESFANIENGRVGIELEKLHRLCLLFRCPMRIMVQLIYEVFEKGSDEGLINAIKQLISIPNDKDESEQLRVLSERPTS